MIALAPIIAKALAVWRWLTNSRAGRTVALVIGALFILWRAYARGRGAAEAEQQQREHEEYVNARERMDRADVQSGGPDADAEWLREYERRRREG